MPDHPEQFNDQVSADRGDASFTVTPGLDAEIQRMLTTLTANRTVTLAAVNVKPGLRIRVVRVGLGAFTVDFGGLKTMPSGSAAWAEAHWSGSAWVLTGYGLL